MATPDLGFAIGLEPAAAVEYFRSKGYAIGFRWQDIAAEAHARAFTVAGVLKIDVLQDVRAELARVLASGGTLADFQKGLQPLLEAKGWWAKDGDPTRIIDHATGELAGKRLTPRRLETIFRTNVQSAYAAGRYRDQVANAAARPWWEYVAILDNRTRPRHRAMSGRIFRYDDPIWSWLYPPNGFRCRCRVRARSERDISHYGLQTSSSEGRLESAEQVIDRHGNTRPAPVYRDPAGESFMADAGFAHNPGRTWQRPFTPPPQDDLPRTFPAGVELPRLPTPTRLDPARLLPAGQSPQDYAQAFLAEFDTALDGATVYRDVTGAPLTVSADLFRDAVGVWKADKAGRGPYVRALADAVREPDEIWLRWEPRRDEPGQWLLRRRYIKSWELPGDAPQFGLSVFEYGEDGWRGATAMMSNPGRDLAARQRYIERQRDGFLAYRK
ncbi:PBECR2 nuclease fold domain-containing protein [Chitiniphilus eburneus]|uniref:PBECR2 nuclease fold domain-containing protein n=1 Tax=Chitiniphilus eburneus TaxID=2571148 RepID=UPI0035CF2340